MFWCDQQAHQDWRVREREREREIHKSIQPALAYEDASWLERERLGRKENYSSLAAN